MRRDYVNKIMKMISLNLVNRLKMFKIKYSNLRERIKLILNDQSYNQYYYDFNLLLLNLFMTNILNYDTLDSTINSCLHTHCSTSIQLINQQLHSCLCFGKPFYGVSRP